MGRTIKRDTAKALGRLIGRANGKQELALRGELADRVVAVISTVDGVVRADMDGMGPAGEEPFTPRTQEIALTIENDNRMLAACDQVDIVLGVDIDPRHFDIAPALWELAPVLHRFICIRAATQHYAWHDTVSSSLYGRAPFPTHSAGCMGCGKISTIFRNIIRYYTSL